MHVRFLAFALIPALLIPQFVIAQAPSVSPSELRQAIIAAAQTRQKNLDAVRYFFTSQAARAALKAGQGSLPRMQSYHRLRPSRPHGCGRKILEDHQATRVLLRRQLPRSLRGRRAHLALTRPANGATLSPRPVNFCPNSSSRGLRAQTLLSRLLAFSSRVAQRAILFR